MFKELFLIFRANFAVSNFAVIYQTKDKETISEWFKINGIFVVDRVKLNIDNKTANASLSLLNDGIHDTVANITVNLFVPLLNIKIDGAIQYQDENDKMYKRTLIRSTFNVESIFKGIEGSYVIRAFMENFRKSIDFDPKLPFSP